MELWVIITIAAAFFQNIRSAVQKYLKGAMGTTGATFVRFGFGVPFALIFWVSFYQYSGENLPSIASHFWLWVTIAALAQIAATFLLIHLFSFRNFTVGTAYSRTEPAQTAMFALILFGEKLSVGGLIAIAISIVGVMLISVARTTITASSMVRSVFTRTALIGLGSGTLFGLAAVGYRAAALAVEHELMFMRSATTLVFAITLQSVVMLVWIIWRERDELGRIAKAWKPALLVGFVGATASFGWFTAFTLQQAALVKVVAQIEMLFTFASSVFFFKERINRPEILGCILITLGIVMLVLPDRFTL
ncbi:MAG: DMT family transporter [Pseudomonadota bacterium]